MLNLKKEFHNIEKIFNYLKIENIEELGVITFLNRDSIFVKTADGSYLVNIVQLKNQESNYSKNQISKIKNLEFFDKNGVHCLLPMSFNDKHFIDYHNKEYEIYRFVNTKHLELKDLSEKQFKKIANSQAIIHNLNVKVNIPCAYQEVKLPSNRKIAKLEKYSPDGYQLLYQHIYEIEEIISRFNKLVKYAMNSLIIGYDNYDLNNIEWIKDYMYLVDYNNCKLINPAVSLAEAAYNFSYQKGEINYDQYKKYLEIYLKRTGSLTYDYQEALYVSQSKRLENLVHIIASSLKTKEDYSPDIIQLVNEIVLYESNIKKMYEIYINIVKEQSN